MVDDRELHEAVLAAVRQPGMLRAHFQPIVDLSRGTVTGYEALARFVGPPQASPDKWFAAAHRVGVGERLEARALEVALGGRAALPTNCFLSVNVGPRAMLSTAVQDVLDAAGDLRGVVIEITEQHAVDDYAPLHAALAPFRERGAMIAVDDAGAGYASLNHIAALEPSLVKVDRGLVAGVDHDPVKAAVIEMLGLFGSRIDAWVLAEGIETLGELERLLALGVPLGQGYRLGRPAPAMAGGDAEALGLCRHRAERASESVLAGLAESAPTAPNTATDGEIAELFMRRPDVRWAALLDEHERPTALAERPSAFTTRRRTAPLMVLAGERVSDVVRRVVTRASSERLAPIALCDAQCRFVGLVPVERLLEHLADVADGGAGGTEVHARTA